MYFQIIERQGKPQSVICSKNLAEAKEQAKQVAIENGLNIIHICKKNEGYGMCGGRTFSKTIHTIKI